MTHYPPALDAYILLPPLGSLYCQHYDDDDDTCSTCLLKNKFSANIIIIINDNQKVFELAINFIFKSGVGGEKGGGGNAKTRKC